MLIEQLRRLWPQPTTRWSHRLAGVAERGARPAGAPAAVDFEDVQAQALCDLVADPTSGITRVSVVSAGPRLLDALEDVAAERGLSLEEQRSPASGGGHISLERAAAATRSNGSNGSNGMKKT